MGFFDLFKPVEKPAALREKVFIPNNVSVPKTVDDSPQRFNKNLGEEHPFDFEQYHNAYLGVPMVQGAVDKRVDFLVSDYYLDCQDDEQVTFFNDWEKKVHFKLYLKQMARNKYVFGSSFSEKVWNNDSIQEFVIQDSRYMFVKRNQNMQVEGYNLFTGKNPIFFEPNEVVHFAYNKIGTCAYGTSLLRSMMGTKKVSALQQKLALEESSHIIMKRKANAPLHVQLGDKDNEPSQTDINTFAAGLEAMTNKTEWVTAYNVQITEKGFAGKVMDPAPLLNHAENQIMYGVQVPEVLLGKGSIPEGLATVQMEAFSIMNSSEQVQLCADVEEQILVELFERNGFGKDFSFKFGKPNVQTPKDELASLLALLNTNLSQHTKREIELKIRDLLDIEGELPEVGVSTSTPVSASQPFQGGETEFFHANESSPYSWYSVRPEVAEEFGILPNVLTALKLADLDLEGLTSSQNELVRKILKSGIKNRAGIEPIAQVLADKVYDGDLEKARLVARTEIAKAENEGALDSYAESENIGEVEWLVHEDERTCSICAPQNGKKFNLIQATGNIPAHPQCRCSWIPVVKGFESKYSKIKEGAKNG
jgi:SPP1 gp7 family putative phage head morphogenesis protein